MTGGISALAVTHADGKIPSHNGFITAEFKSLGATDAHMCTVVEGLGVELGINIMEKLKIWEDILIEAEFQFFSDSQPLTYQVPADKPNVNPYVKRLRVEMRKNNNQLYYLPRSMIESLNALAKYAANKDDSENQHEVFNQVELLPDNARVLLELELLELKRKARYR
ncbi:hypothetical protein M5689_019168 [Euphorbia peplus]|nr:hypothetical protein M5689_019168 [Euphorbia peplus]